MIDSEIQITKRSYFIEIYRLSRQSFVEAALKKVKHDEVQQIQLQ